MKLLLVDGHYYAYRSFYAIQNLSNSRGEPTNALYGMTKALRRMLTDLQPDLAAVIMDGGLPAARLEQQSDYKANRVEMPAALAQQLSRLGELVPALGFSLLCTEGEEADDLIACYVGEAQRQNIDAVLATNDKDLLQLVSPGVRVYQPGPTGFELFDEAKVTEKWGVPPEKIGQILMLTGDNADNIPGVPGIGPKTAAGLIREFGTVENLLANLVRVKSEKQRAVLAASRDLLARNRVMIGLRTDLALPKPLRELVVQPDLAAQVSVFTRLEFRTFQREAGLLWERRPVLEQGELL